MSSQADNKNRPFFMVLAVAFVAGLAVALVLCLLWRYHSAVLNGQLRVVAIAICPPFMLAAILEATTDSTLALIMTVGTVIFANGFLYAGVASFAYFLTTVFLRKRA